MSSRPCTIAALHRQLDARLAAAYAQDAASVQQFLATAARGEAGLIDPAGRSRLPQLNQRRRAPRAQRTQNCRIDFGAGLCDARLEDVSRTGVGLACDQEISTGTDVIVILQDGRRLAATVARRTGSRLGLALHEPLSSLDPLLIGS